MQAGLKFSEFELLTLLPTTPRYYNYKYISGFLLTFFLKCFKFIFIYSLSEG